MEGKYTKIGAVIGVIGLIITIGQIRPKIDKKIDGEWIMTCKILEADLKAYEGKESKWKMFLTEKDQIVKGNAEKIEVDNTVLEYDQRTIMQLEGNLKGAKITLNYTEEGKLRNTQGILTATVTDNEFTGHFSQTASSTSGDIFGVKTIRYKFCKQRVRKIGNDFTVKR